MADVKIDPVVVADHADARIALLLAIALLIVDVALLAIAFRARTSSGFRERLHVNRYLIVTILVLLPFASGFAYFVYDQKTTAAGGQERLDGFNEFADRTSSFEKLTNRLDPTYANDDVIDLDGTTPLIVSLHPDTSFGPSFGRWAATPAARAQKLFIKMRVTAPTFDVTPLFDETQLVPRDVMTFAWMLRARASGDQRVDVQAVAFDRAPDGTLRSRATVVNAIRVIHVRQAIPLDTWTPIAGGILSALAASALPLLIGLRKREPGEKPASAGERAATGGTDPQHSPA